MSMQDTPVIDIGTDGTDIIGCASNRTIESAILILGSNKFRRLPITKLGKIEGILTITDILGIITKVGLQESFKEKVSDWMTDNPKRIHLDTNVLETVKKMVKLGIGSLLLVGENPDMCMGIVTERDILYFYKSDKWANTKLKEIDEKYLKIGVRVIEYQTSLEDAIKEMSENKTHRLLVKNKDNQGLYGMISANDITHLITKEREEISNNANFLNNISAGFVSSGKLTTVTSDCTLVDAIDVMKKNKFGALPVMDDKGNLMGMISERSLLHYIAETEK